MELRDESARTALQRDDDELVALLIPYGGVIYRSVYSYVTWSSCPKQEALDIVQETLYRAIRWIKRSPESISTIKNTQAYLVEIAMNVANDQHKKYHPNRDTENDLAIVSNLEDMTELPDVSTPSPEAAFEAKEQRKERMELIQHLLGDLSEEDRWLIWLRHGEEQKYDDIATVTGLSREDVQHRVKNAMRRIQRKAANVLPQ